jgi:hypothetical protein
MSDDKDNPAIETDRMEREWAEKIAEAGVLTEAQMRDAEVPWLKTPEELSAYIAKLVDRPHDYGTCCYAMSMAAVAAFHYVAHVLGVTGFQASCADLDILKRTRHMTGPFMIVNGEDLLYPQYDVPGRVEEFIRGQRAWLAEEAKRKIADSSNGRAHPAVRAHWDRLIAAAADAPDPKEP